jgi:hypothetical protein
MKYVLFSLIILMTTVDAFSNPSSKESGTFTLHFPEAAYSSVRSLQIPFRLSGLHLILQAEVNGRRGNFMIDTGAETLVLNSRYFKGGWNKRNQATGALGRVEEARSCIVKIRDWSEQPMRADLINLSHLESQKGIPLLGLIGYEAIKDFELLIDLHTQNVVLFMTDDKGVRYGSHAFTAPPVDSIRFDLIQHMAIIYGSLEGRPLIFGLDTGSELNLLDDKLDSKIRSHFKPITNQVSINDIGGRSSEGHTVGRLEHLWIEGKEWPAMRTLLVDLAALNQMLNTRLDGVLGMEFLIRRKAVINYKRKMIYFMG